MDLFKLFSLNYLILLLLIFFINLVILSYREKIANNLKINDIPNHRKIHKIQNSSNWWYLFFYYYFNSIFIQFL